MPIEILQYIEQHGEYFCFLLLLGFLSLFDICHCVARLFLEHLNRKGG